LKYKTGREEDTVRCAGYAGRCAGLEGSAFFVKDQKLLFLMACAY